MSAQEVSPLFSANDRILVVAPHPDDEALGLGGALQSAGKVGAAVKIVYLTNGESNEVSALFYQKRPLVLRSDFIKSGVTRKNEASQAMDFLGIGTQNLVFLGFPDGGTLNIWLKYWGDTKSFRSLFTRFNKVPFPGNFSYGHSYKGDDIVRDLKKVLVDFKPTQIFVTAPFDLNTDHQAAYLYLKVALLDVSVPFETKPQLSLYLVHAHGWPKPKKYLPEEPLHIPKKMVWKNGVHWRLTPLSRLETEKKQALILKYKSQIAYKKNFLLSFARANELFVDYPDEKIIPEAATQASNVKPAEVTRSDNVIYRVVGKELWIDIPLANSLDEMGVLNGCVFGYRQDISFSDMPKLTFKLFGNKLFVKDAFRSVHDERIGHQLENNRLFLRIPLSVLKDPDHLFVSTHNAKEELSLDFGSWRILEIVKSQ